MRLGREPRLPALGRVDEVLGVVILGAREDGQRRVDQGCKIRSGRDRIIRIIRKSAIFFEKFAEILRSERCEGLQIL